MADIKEWGIGGGNGIEGFTPEDPYYYEIENRPLVNLTNNDILLNNELQSMTPKFPVETPDGSTKIFTFPNGEKAISGSLLVYLNGRMYNPNNVQLINGATQFAIVNNDFAPLSTDYFYVVYRKIEESPLYLVIDSPYYTASEEAYIRQSIATGTGVQQNFGGSGVVIDISNIPIDNTIEFSSELEEDSGTPSGTIETETFTQPSGEIVFSGDSVVNLESDQGGTGTFDYLTGEYTLNFARIPANGSDIIAKYRVL